MTQLTPIAPGATGRRQAPSLVVMVLGAVTVAAYGVAYYSYGVLIDPILSTTGWSQAALGAVFSAALVIGGAGGLAGGRLVDRLGTRPACTPSRASTPTSWSARPTSAS